jgi:hypothetical protein
MHVQRFAQVFGAVYLVVGVLGLYFGLAGRRTVASTA